MKIIPTVVALLLAVGLKAQPPAAAQDLLSSANAPKENLAAAARKYSVVERGRHHRVWQYTTWNTNALGKAFAVTNSYTELETGMNRRTDDGQWIECNPQIHIQPFGGAIAD